MKAKAIFLASTILAWSQSAVADPPEMIIETYDANNQPLALDALVEHPAF